MSAYRKLTGPAVGIALTVAVCLGAPAAMGASPDPSTFVIGDGEPWITYQWLQECDADGCDKQGVYLVRPDGRDRHLLLTTPVGHPDWSPDGKRLAVETEPADGEQIWVLQADGTDVTVVTCDGEPCGPAAAPAWSPDGRQLAFQRGVPRRAGEDFDRVAIEVVDLVTGATHVVAESPAAGSEYVEYVGPRWSPDGTQIVFTVMRYPVPPTDENILGSSIAIADADGSDGDAPLILTDPAMFGSYPDWSSDGGRIVFNTYPLGSFQDTTKATNLYTIAPDGTGLTQVTHFGENDTRATQPTWTPNGQAIVFTQIKRKPTHSWGERQVAIIDADGSDVTLVPLPAGVGAPGEVWAGQHARMRPTP